MLTKITVSGYKSLQGTAAQFAPFTVIVGRNNVGKSNLFDALRLLSNVAQMPVANAFKPERHRGDPVESFFSEKQPSLSLSCEIDLTGAPHPFIPDQSLSHPLLRYEVELVFLNLSMVFVSESLVGRSPAGEPRNLIAPDPEDKSKLFVAEDTPQSSYFVNTKRVAEDKSKLSVAEEASNGGRLRPFSVPAPRSILTMIDDAELYPHIVALARELSSWRFFHFEPEALREPSPAMDILELEPSGRGLSGFYDTLFNHDPERFRFAERALRRGIPEARGLKVLDTGDRRRLLAVVRDDGREFTARVLSDGTLRFLALLALAYAPQPPGLVCFEEPENGVHPSRLPFIVDTLRGLSERGSEEGRRSQVIVNSHSPYVVDLLKAAEIRLAVLNETGQTRLISVAEDVFAHRPLLKRIFEDGEQTLGELWAQGSLNANA